MRSDDGAIYAGRLSAGQTAASEQVEVRLSERGVEIARAGCAAPLTWPFGALTVATPIDRTSEDVLLGYTYMPGASLFVSDRHFVARLMQAAPQLGVAAQRWRWARPLLAIGGAILVVIAVAWVLELSPARTIAGLMPDGVRQSLGRQVIQSMAGGRRVCDAPAGRAALDRLTERLSAASGSYARFSVTVLDWNLLNAFAAPGEQIVLTRELIEQARSADEVAGVLAHEMGHGLERHPESSIVRVVGLNVAIELVLGGGGGTLANLGLLLTQLSYTRAAEREADAHALRILERAAISPQGIVGFFRRIEGMEGGRGSSAGLDLLRSHPATAERVRLAAARPHYPSTPALSEADWRALRAICSPGGGPRADRAQGHNGAARHRLDAIGAFSA
ncbi:MAG TPA: M48 family metallopeptidase [Hyphomicrobiaceae bacterium]|nr:M48 family metallopeptidase [Hyphomicrobiaceae bacterium]